MRNEDKSGTMTVLVASCDKYADLLEPFAVLYRKYWPDCPYETVLCTETVGAEGFDRVILGGKGKNWSTLLGDCLDEITTPYVLVLLDDYFLVSRVDTNLVAKRLEEAIRDDALNYRLCPEPPRAVKNTAYSISCKAGIWNRQFLRSLLRKTASAWEFERYGSFMFDENDPRPLKVSARKEFPFIDAVRKGYWEKFGVKCLLDNGIEYDFSKRSLPPVKVRVVEGIKALIFAIFPSDWIVRVQNIFNIGKK